MKKLNFALGLVVLAVMSDGIADFGQSDRSQVSAAQDRIDRSPQEGDTQRLEEAPGRRVISLNAKPGRFNEPSIAINPLNPQQLVASFQRMVSVGYSTDGGEHWDLARGTAPADYLYSGDSSIIYDDKGHAILCYIAFDILATFNYWAHNSPRNGVFVRRSFDGGKTWEANAITVAGQTAKSGIFEDKPYIVADSQPGSPYAGNLYVGWTRDRVSDAVMVLSRSTDVGTTWSTPVQMSDKPGLPRDDNGTVEGFSGVVTPDGNLHAVWSDTTHIVYTASRDGGRTFSRNHNIVETAPSHFIIFDTGHVNGYPRIDMAAVKGKKPRLYVTWSDYRNGDTDVFCASSPDEGRTWGQPIRVNTDAIHDGADHFFSWLSVDPISSDVYILFLDRRRDPDNRKVDVVIARSKDGGQTFDNFLLSEQPFDPMDTTIGDYTGLVAYDGRVFGAWTEIVGSGDILRDSSIGTRRESVMRIGMADFRNSTKK